MVELQLEGPLWLCALLPSPWPCALLSSSWPCALPSSPWPCALLSSVLGIRLGQVRLAIKKKQQRTSKLQFYPFVLLYLSLQIIA